MWHKKKAYNRVIIGCNPEYFCLAWIKVVPDNLVMLMRYKKIACPNLEIHKSILFNPTLVRNAICQFLTQYKLSSARISMWITGSGIGEKLIKTITAYPTALEIGVNTATHHGDWQYLYPLEDNYLAFYVTHMPKELIFQYQLLAIACDMNLITITTYSQALFHLYHHIQGTAFRHTKFMHDMEQAKNRVAYLFNLETITRVMRIHPAITISPMEEYIPLLGIVGLHTMEILHEKN